MNQQPNTEGGSSAEYHFVPEAADSLRVAVLERCVASTMPLRAAYEVARIGGVVGVPRPDDAQIDR